jgi:hypothetical protein
MIESLFSTTLTETLTIESTLSVIFAASGDEFVYQASSMSGPEAKTAISPGFVVTLIMLPAIISIIILLVGNKRCPGPSVWLALSA